MAWADSPPPALLMSLTPPGGRYSCIGGLSCRKGHGVGQNTDFLNRFGVWLLICKTTLPPPPPVYSTNLRRAPRQSERHSQRPLPVSRFWADIVNTLWHIRSAILFTHQS
ncbi:hypothetical protein B0T16DRAFT_84429 [Cercophora newfieldiana]|uniref:Uncharacterized protein n=1 Tax=Cercophora newfieldiana TaxID=92897 RepID=A0AA39YFY5_9PEZI|nr:hypothetical protein B0T16DRAFT_84429 [Cercophora newfieldiana]